MAIVSKLNQNFLNAITELANRTMLFVPSTCGVEGRLLVKTCAYRGHLGSEQKVYQPCDVSANLSLPGYTLDTVQDIQVDSAPTFAGLALTNDLVLTGGGRVTKDIWLNVQGLKAPGIKPATLVDYGIGDAWKFIDGTDDTIVGRIKLPRDIDKSVGLTILIGWNATTANAGNCIWQVEYLLRQEDEAMDAVATGTLTNTVAASTIAKGFVVSSIGTTVVPHTSDICITVRVKRRADLAGDTLGEDNHLFGVCFSYVSNKLGEIM